MEPTGVYHKPLLEYLLGKGEEVVLISPVAACRNRESLDGRWDKNDLSDSANAADLLGQGKYLFADSPQQELRELRSVVGTRARMRKIEHMLRMQIRNGLIVQFFPGLECGYGKGGQDRVVLRVVSRCFDPGQIAGMGFEAFWNLIAEPRWGKAQERARTGGVGGGQGVGGL